MIRTCCAILIAALATVPSPARAVDPAAGKALATTCFACHGEDGIGIAPTYPHLAGQGRTYLVRQMTLFKEGTRSAPLMAGQLDGFDEREIENIAAYYASKPAPIGQVPAESDVVELGESIYRGGIMSKGVAACQACHSPTGQGNDPAGFPQLGGQPIEYLVQQLTAFREGERETDEEYGGMMQDTAGGLTDSEIRAVSTYIHGLH